MTDTSRADRRAARRQRRAESPVLQLPFRPMRNPLPPMEVIGPDQLEQLHAASMRILEEIGLNFMDAETLSILEQAGARVDYAKQHAWLDRGLVLEAVAKAPHAFNWRARNPARNVPIGGDTIALAPQGGVAYVNSLDRGRRRGTLDDYENFLKINQMVGVLHFAGEQLIAPYEVPA